MSGYRAPGRVNLIGEHVDYAGGLVLPAALEQGIRLDGERTADRTVRLTSATAAGEVVIELDRPQPARAGWARYAAAVVTELVAAGIDVPGFRGRLESDLPDGAGVSSSAALEVCVAGALAAAAGAALEGIALAQLAQRAEHRAVGVPCGIMDQAASVLGRRGQAVLLDCETLEHRAVPLPDGLALLVLDSGVRRRLEDSGYAQRRREVETALAALAPGAARTLAPDEALAAARAAGVDGAPLARLRHVVSERVRVEQVVAALEQPGEPDLAAIGRAFAEGHRSLRDDFAVSTAELDLLVELAREEGAVAARMTGGGFGGSIVALAAEPTAGALGARVAERYAARTGRAAAVLVSRAGDGAGASD